MQRMVAQATTMRWGRFQVRPKGEHMAFYELTPAYGRDYKNKAEVTAAFNAGKDFEGDYQLGFGLVNKEQLPAGSTVMLRYKRNTMVTSVKV